MDKIWNRNPSKSEVIGRCGGDEKNEWPRRTDNSPTLKKIKMFALNFQALVILPFKFISNTGTHNK